MESKIDLWLNCANQSTVTDFEFMKCEFKVILTHNTLLFFNSLN